MTTLYVPIALAALGIVLRGSGFAFRKSIEGLSARRAAGATFALSSVLTPFFMGAVVGAIAAGNVPADGNGARLLELARAAAAADRGDVRRQRRLSLRRLPQSATRAAPGTRRCERYFARRALLAAAVAGARRRRRPGRAARRSPLHLRPPHREGLPLVILSAALRPGRLVLLLAAVRRREAASPWLLRPLAAGAVVAVIWGWGVAQFPYLLPTSLKIDQSAAPRTRLSTVIVVFIVAAILVLPSLALLYWLSQKELLGE